MGCGVGREEEKPPQVKTRGDQLPTDGPDHTTRPKGQLVCSTGANVSVMVLQGPKYSPQKSRPLESGHRRHGVCIAIECSYKLDQKMNLNFCVNYAHFRKSGHVCLC